MTALPPQTITAPKPSSSFRNEKRAGLAAIILFFGLFLGWAAFAPLDAGAFAEGQVTVSGNRQAVQHREGGVVTALDVAEGDHVIRGQVLVRLGTGDLVASERSLASQLAAERAVRARLIAERDGLSSIPAPGAFDGMTTEDHKLGQEAMRLQRGQFSARSAGRNTEAGVLQQRVQQLN